ncbi:hypothetical protein NB568_05960 [Vibrio alginolyticus]|uniref:hypothetical protein n=1 Tax=Vibrio TaxID=662 RepID=UPI00045F25FC|nr:MULTISPECIES: hypothetical protein [Vibrio]MCR9902329.1 hypothetical protein [Vibrio alginolyticus]MDW2297485.1 hypothetical protein [Vibrio sp. 1404]MDW2302980.1 hypothetical protein [Vibrio sp. 1167]GAK18842.1 hypothetical protein JCM19053_4305 [Vibrio sp. JCM 19053]
MEIIRRTSRFILMMHDEIVASSASEVTKAELSGFHLLGYMRSRAQIESKIALNGSKKL